MSNETAEPDEDFVGMSDIARIAGKSRSTVGNWKARKPDFPEQRGQSNRGPLYRRDEVVDWLRRNGHIPSAPLADVEAPSRLWRIADIMRADGSLDDLVPLVLLLVLAAKEAPAALDAVRSRPVVDPRDCIHELSRALDLSGRIEVPEPRHLRPETLRRVVDEIAAGGGSLSEAVPHLLDRVAATLGRSGSAELPPGIGAFLVGLCSPRGTVYDPCAGTGGLLAHLFEGEAPLAEVESVIADERSPDAAAIAFLRHRLAGVQLDYGIADVLDFDPRPGLLAQCIVSAPPFGVRRDNLDPGDPRWRYADPKKDGDAAYLQHAVAHLAADGSATLLIPPGALFRRGPALRVLQQLLREDIVDAVIGLPAGALRSTTIASAVLVLARGRTHKGVAGSPGPVLMIDGSDLQVEKGSGAVQGLSGLADIYRAWRAEATWSPEDEGVAHAATYQEIADEEFVLDPRRYMVSPMADVNIGDLQRRRAKLVTEFGDVTAVAAEASGRLLKTLTSGGRR